MAYIRNLDESVPNGFLTTTPAHATQYLESILESGNSAGTRNRALAACSRFFKWCKVKGHIEVNPFAGIKSLKEGDNGEMIVYCTVEERTRVLSVAESWDRPDWIAIPIALYAGCRREEVFKLQWEDVNFETRRMIIRESKTGQRLTPLSKELLTILTAHKKPRGLVVERLKDQTWQNQADRLVEMVKEHLCRPENPTLAGGASEAIGKRRFLKTQEDLLAVPSNLIKQGKEFRKNSKAGSAKKILHLAIHFAGQQGCPEKAHDGGDWIPAERIGWNAFRHTFATLRAQAGVSLDKITSWMGNTPDVCRKHYAQFMPRDSHDEDIDK